MLSACFVAVQAGTARHLVLVACSKLSMWTVCTCTCREVGHHTYVTPTSYLELINTYTQLLGAQQAAVDQLRKRYEVSTFNRRAVRQCMRLTPKLFAPLAWGPGCRCQQR